MCLLCEEFARGQIPMGFFSVSMITAGAVERFGTEEQKQEILGGVARGRVEAIAMSEPEAGSDVGNLSCRAERSNGGYVINGQKTWITAAHAADHILLVCRTNRTGNKPFDDTIAYVKERKQFGRAIGTFQALRHRLADLAVEIESARLLVYDTAARVDANPGTLFPCLAASMAKLKATEAAKHATLEGMQMMGGYGYAAEYDMERQVRTAVVTTIYGGTSEIQRDIIAKTLGL